jgi:hypothetical protein
VPFLKKLAQIEAVEIKRSAQKKADNIVKALPSIPKLRIVFRLSRAILRVLISKTEHFSIV